MMRLEDFEMPERLESGLPIVEVMTIGELDPSLIIALIMHKTNPSEAKQFAFEYEAWREMSETCDAKSNLYKSLVARLEYVNVLCASTSEYMLEKRAIYLESYIEMIKMFDATMLRTMTRAKPVKGAKLSYLRLAYVKGWTSRD